jgi:hypothetical protein
MILIRDVDLMSKELEKAFDDIEELTGARPKITPKATKRLWVIFDNAEPVFLCGMSQHSLVGQPVFWFMPCKRFMAKPLRYMKAIKFLLPMVKENYPSFRVEVAEDNETNIRFVEAYGFKYSHTTENMKVYEV